MKNIPIVYMPDGKPCPLLLTEKELAQFLRLDLIEVKFPSQSIRRYRDAGLLQAVQISKQILYPLWSVIEFIEKQQAAVNR
ncbi:MAG: hypothetical protein DRP56_03980 [Planctomycetota bacterium]|nr:MAG: hypothetical protein DRP56_03980 [Planctomycetota bacterium]